MIHLDRLKHPRQEEKVGLLCVFKLGGVPQFHGSGAEVNQLVILG